MRLSSLFAYGVRVLTAICVVVVGIGSSLLTAEASWKGYDASVVSVQTPTTMAPGATASVQVTMRNTGTKTWMATGKEQVSIYHWDPARKVETASVFATASWLSALRPAVLPAASVRVGERVTWTFPVQAPRDLGVYSGEFIVAAEDVAWLKGSRFRVQLRVEGGSTGSSASTAPAPSVTPPPAPSTAAAVSTFSPDASGSLQARVTNGGGLLWVVDAGQDMAVRFVFQNTGLSPWTNLGPEALRLVPLESDRRSRSSVFAHPTWVTKELVQSLPARVSLGGDVAMVFSLRAPELPGSYRERFALVSPAGTLVPGSEIEMVINVNPGTGFVATDVSDLGDTSSPTTQDQLPAVPRASEQAALRAVSSSSIVGPLSLLGNGRQQVTIGWKNVGTESWNRLGVRLVSSEPWVRASWLADTTWSDGRPPEATVSARPRETVFYSFFIKAPPKMGTYAFTYRLFVNGSPAQGSDVSVSIRVTSNGTIVGPDLPPPSPSSPSTSTPAPATQPPVAAQPLGGNISSLPAEPMIRVGIYQPPHAQLQVRALMSGAEVRVSGTAVCSVSLGQTVMIAYDRSSGTYTLSGPGSCSGSSRTPYLVRAADGTSPLEIADFVRPSTWIFNASDNDFRGQLELRASNDQRELWVINELPIEAYLKGIAETSNISPPEFQRTLLVAARTYAMYHVSRGTKHANKGFIVEGTVDQVYRGYQMEMRAPNISAAVDATRGQIVTYNERLAITPYFSRSDGRTRSWGEVWAGGSSYPWLVTVPVPEDQGRTLWGHGVGMSATGALSMANNGRGYEQILKHFYTGIELRRAYR